MTINSYFKHSIPTVVIKSTKIGVERLLWWAAAQPRFRAPSNHDDVNPAANHYQITLQSRSGYRLGTSKGPTTISRTWSNTWKTNQNDQFLWREPVADISIPILNNRPPVFICERKRSVLFVWWRTKVIVEHVRVFINAPVGTTSTERGGVKGFGYACSWSATTNVFVCNWDEQSMSVVIGRLLVHCWPTVQQLVRSVLKMTCSRMVAVTGQKHR